MLRSALIAQKRSTTTASTIAQEAIDRIELRLESRISALRKVAPLINALCAVVTKDIQINRLRVESLEMRCVTGRFAHILAGFAEKRPRLIIRTTIDRLTWCGFAIHTIVRLTMRRTYEVRQPSMRT